MRVSTALFYGLALLAPTALAKDEWKFYPTNNNVNETELGWVATCLGRFCDKQVKVKHGDIIRCTSKGPGESAIAYMCNPRDDNYCSSAEIIEALDEVRSRGHKTGFVWHNRSRKYKKIIGFDRYCPKGQNKEGCGDFMDPMYWGCLDPHDKRQHKKFIGKPYLYDAEVDDEYPGRPDYKGWRFVDDDEPEIPTITIPPWFTPAWARPSATPYLELS